MKLLTITVMLMAGLLNSVPSIACDDHVGKCEIEGLLWNISHEGIMDLQGVTTCDNGRVIIRIYEKIGEDERFLGTTTGYIEGHAFIAVAYDIEPITKDSDDIMIRHAIRQD